MVAGSTQVTGSDLPSTAFTTELRVGDIITTASQTKMVQEVIDDQHASVASVFSTPLSHETFVIGNLHDEPFTVASRADGTVYANSTLLTGLGTQFAGQLEVGFSILVKIGNDYISRDVQTIMIDTSLVLSSALPVDIASSAAVEFFYRSCPAQKAELEAGNSGTFSLHAKSSRPSLCYNTGRCIPTSSHVDTFERVGTGAIAGTTSSTSIIGTGTNFMSELQHGYSLSVYTATQVQTRKVVSITSPTSCTVDQPFSFDIAPSTNQPFIIRYLTGRGTISNAGGANYTVTGTATQFIRDLEVGFVIAVGNQKRTVMSIVGDTQMTINAPFNHINGGVSGTGYGYEACLSGGVSTAKQLTVDYALLEPGCCGFKSVGAVSGGNFAYYQVTPPSTNYNVRVVATADIPQLEVYMRYAFAPDANNYDFKAVSSYSPWQIELPQSRLRCPTNTSSCESLYIGVRGLSGGGTNIPFEVASYLEFDFPNFACAEAVGTTLSTKCAALGLQQVSDASFVSDVDDANNANVMRLTSATSSQQGAVWYGTKLHLEDGFESSFTFKMSSSCTSSSTGCGAGDGFAFVIHSNDATNVIGCGGRSLGFASDAETSCSGITRSFAVEFDTWHNPELRDINIRGSGTVEVNATTVPRYNYVHAAFFSNGEQPNSNSHDRQLAGTPAIPSVNDGNWHTARVVYIPGTTSAAPGRLFLYIDDMQSFVLTAPVRFTRSGACGGSSTDRCILDSFGNAYIGFTAATGEVGQSHDVSRWLFCDEPGCGRS